MPVTAAPMTPVVVQDPSQTELDEGRTPAATLEPSASAFRHAMGQFATGITVVATRDSEEEFVGLTVNSFNSVSLHPPLVLWSLSKHSRYLATFRQAPRYTISVLNAEQEEVSRLFSTRHSQRFHQVAHELTPHGLPVIAQACAWFECTQRSQYEEGDHVIFIGQVESCVVTPSAPLIYFNSAYQSLSNH